MHPPPRRRAAILLALLAAACAAPATGPEPIPAPVPEPEEWDRELPAGVFLEDGEPEGVIGFVPVRVVDDATGDPIPGARIQQWQESDWPHAEPWEGLLERTVTTDRDGWALIPGRDAAPWNYVEAPGYAPIGDHRRQDEHRLVRGQDFAMEIRDWRGRPVPGAVVDLFLGCGHTPNARCETADARGRLLFRCIDFRYADFWIRAPGVAGRASAYGQGWDGLPIEDGFHVLFTEPGPVQEGRVLRPDGSPASGALVGTRAAHRGPWTVADADGRFRLAGASPWADLEAVAPLADAVPEGFMPAQVGFESAPGVFATVRLPEKGERWPTPEEAKAARAEARAASEARDRGEEPEPIVPPGGSGIRVRMTTAPGVAPSGRAGVRAIRDGDGRLVSDAPLFRDGVATREIVLEPGDWTVTAGYRTGRFRPESRRAQVREGVSEVAFTLHENPRWRPRVVDQGPDGRETERPRPLKGSFELYAEDAAGPPAPGVGPDGEPDGSIFVPAEGPFTVRYRDEDGRDAWVLLEGPPSDAGPAIRYPPHPPEVAWDEDPDRPREFPSAQLTVLLPDGKPAASALVYTLAPWTERTPTHSITRGETRRIDLGEDGTAEASFDRGERIQVEPPDDDGGRLRPFVTRIDGPGPWALRWPDGEVRLRIVDEAGAPIPWATVLLSGSDEFAAEDGTLTLRGVAPGPLRLWVGEEERRSRDLRLVLKPGEKREVIVRLNPAAPTSASK